MYIYGWTGSQGPTFVAAPAVACLSVFMMYSRVFQTYMRVFVTNLRVFVTNLRVFVAAPAAVQT